MKVGTLAETITVTGETPLVDVQSATVQKVVTKEVVDSIPTGRLGINLAALQPGHDSGRDERRRRAARPTPTALTSQDVGGTAGDTFTDLSIHGSKASEQRQTIGGVSAATVIRFGESLSSSPSFTAMQEMSVDSSGADASLAGGGVRLNYVPRDGGNTFKGLLFFSGANGSMQATNYTTDRRRLARGQPAVPRPADAAGRARQGLRLQSRLRRSDEEGQSVVVRQRAVDARRRTPSRRTTRTRISSPARRRPTLNNTTLTYTPDQTAGRCDQLGGGGDFQEQTLRLSWQVNPKNKIGAYYNNKKRVTATPTPRPRYEALNYGVLLPVLGPVAALVGAGHQQAAARGGRLAPPGDVGRRDLAVRSWSIRWRSASPTPVRVAQARITPSSSRTTTAASATRRTRRATTRTRGRTSPRPT